MYINILSEAKCESRDTSHQNVQIYLLNRNQEQCKFYFPVIRIFLVLGPVTCKIASALGNLKRNMEEKDS
jgi:hypothetical protein